jgi:hypothetical protein
MMARPRSNPKRRGARPVHLWAKLPDQPEDTQVRGIDVAKVDQRTTLGRELKRLHIDLWNHVREKSGREPDAVETILISQCVRLRAQMAVIEKQRLNGDVIGQHADNSYMAWANCFRRYLASLGYGEQVRLMHRRVEASVMRAYS